MVSVESLIQVVNKLQDCFASLGYSCPIDLPQIAVVGEQSAGKSSVLENFVGKDFLPRGAGIVTRRPLVLQLINQEGPEYAMFLHLPNKKFIDFLEVRWEIESETNRVTGLNKNISPIPINLRVFSPQVLNLTLVDLPGLTKVPIGDQPSDIEAQTRNMLLSFISNPNCLILAVTPAVVDLANSEALKMAREVDPDRTRTIGVITKIDMMDEGTDCREVLDNRVYPLKRGYVGVVNRSQKNIIGQKNIRAAQDAEIKYFLSHPVYSNMVERMGSNFLQRTLNNQLSQHIKETLPSLKHKIQDELLMLENEMGSNLHKPEINGNERAKILMTLIQELAKQIDIVLGYQHEFVDTKELSGGSIINNIMYQRFPYELSRVRPDTKKMRAEIKMAIINSQGVRSTIFTPDVAFTSVAKKHIAKTRDPCTGMAELVAAEILKIIDKTCGDIFGEYPILLTQIINFCQQQISEAIIEAKKYINLYVDAELAHINTKHPDFINFDYNEKKATDENAPNNMNTSFEQIVFKKGFLAIVSQGFLKSNRNEFFVLKGSTLSSYKDQSLNDQRFQINLEGCRIRDYLTGYSTKRNCFQLYHKYNKMISKDMKELDLSCQYPDEAEQWKAAFTSAGVLTDIKQDPSTVQESDQLGGGVDVQVVKQVEYIFALVDTYLNIVNKNEVDVISKICVTCIILKIREKIPTDTVAWLVSGNKMENLMKENVLVIEKRREMQNIYKSCKEALDIIHDVMNEMGVDGSSHKYPAPCKNFNRIKTDHFESNRHINDNSTSITSNKPKRPPPTRC